MVFFDIRRKDRPNRTCQSTMCFDRLVAFIHPGFVLHKNKYGQKVILMNQIRSIYTKPLTGGYLQGTAHVVQLLQHTLKGSTTAVHFLHKGFKSFVICNDEHNGQELPSNEKLWKIWRARKAISNDGLMKFFSSE